MTMSASRVLALGATIMLALLLTLARESPAEMPPASPAAPDLTNAGPPAAAGLPSVSDAREQAKLLHDVYASTLEVLHDRYFHDERAIVPARAMEDVFAEQAAKSRIEARWISVNMKPMSVRHEPKSDFEKQAADALANGKDDHEAVEGGYYRRAATIPLSNGCTSCHNGFFKSPPKSPRFAGLVISVPVQVE